MLIGLLFLSIISVIPNNLILKLFYTLFLRKNAPTKIPIVPSRTRNIPNRLFISPVSGDAALSADVPAVGLLHNSVVGARSPSDSRREALHTGSPCVNSEGCEREHCPSGRTPVVDAVPIRFENRRDSSSFLHILPLGCIFTADMIE